MSSTRTTSHTQSSKQTRRTILRSVSRAGPDAGAGVSDIESRAGRAYPNGRGIGLNFFTRFAFRGGRNPKNSSGTGSFSSR